MTRLNKTLHMQEGLQNIASTASVTAGTFEIEVPVDKAIRYSGHADTETMAEHRE